VQCDAAAIHDERSISCFDARLALNTSVESRVKARA